MPHTHIKSATQSVSSAAAHDVHDNLKTHNLNPSRPTDKSHYLMAGIFEIKDGELIPGHYPGPSVIYIIQGQFHLVDKAIPGAVTKVSANDVVHVDEGSEIDWSSPTGGKAFGVTYAPTTYNPEDMVTRK